MSFLSSGEIKKMVIQACKDVKFTEDPSLKYTAQVNPESYTVDYTIVYNKQQAQGTSSTELKFSHTAPQEMGFDFLFDGTGVLSGADLLGNLTGGLLDSGEESLVDQVENFKKIVFEYNGETHQPRYLKLFWGTLLFKCRLTSMNITYKLFQPDGTPLRAVAKCKFMGVVEDNLRVALENAQSPDLTHIRTVNDGDTLPLMCYKIYGDASWYLEVARVNKLKDFKKLKTGQQLFFPPLEKTNA